MKRRPETPKISFGMIVLNGEPYLAHNLRALYPFAHEIIVVEGAYWAAKGHATPDGHSIDSTLEVLGRFQAEEDPRGIVQVVRRDDFWDGLTAQSQAYAERATGDYLWQIDVDEFYLPETMQRVIDELAADPSIAMMTFKAINFIYDIDCRLLSGRDFQRDYIEYRRVFKWGPGYQYVEHEPPTVVDDQGRDVGTVHLVDKNATARMGLFMHHYWAIFPEKVRMKADAYVQRDWEGVSAAMPAWLANWETLADPFHLQSDFEYATWLRRYRGPHPPEIVKLREECEQGRTTATLRYNADLRKLMTSFRYRFRRLFVALWQRVRGYDSYLRAYKVYGPIRFLPQCGVRLVRRLTGRAANQS